MVPQYASMHEVPLIPQKQMYLPRAQASSQEPKSQQPQHAMFVQQRAASQAASSQHKDPEAATPHPRHRKPPHGTKPTLSPEVAVGHPESVVLLRTALRGLLLS